MAASWWRHAKIKKFAWSIHALVRWKVKRFAMKVQRQHRQFSYGMASSSPLGKLKRKYVRRNENFKSALFSFSNSFNRSSERQYSLRAPDALDDPIVMVELDTSNGVMFPLYDPDTNLVFLCGKGDSVIRYFEVSFCDFRCHFSYFLHSD